MVTGGGLRCSSLALPEKRRGQNCLNLATLHGPTPRAAGSASAADSDDSARLEITDAVLLLGVLFLGQGEIRPQHPACGPAPTADALDCREPGAKCR
jgi:hypothetical protein